MTNIVTEILVNILIFFVIGVIITVGNALRKWLEAKMTESQENDKILVWKTLYDIVRFVVQGIEQMYLSGENWSSETKKQKAVSQVQDWVKTNGYENLISDKLISTLIEACVKEMNDEAYSSDES